MGLFYLFTCTYSPVSNNWRISKRGRHTMTRRKISASWMVRYKLFFFLVYPPSLPSHPHTRVSMAMSLFDLSVCLVCPPADSPLELSYVDLVLNPERYTGYAGHSPHRIWGAIYHENCFRWTTPNTYCACWNVCRDNVLQKFCWTLKKCTKLFAVLICYPLQDFDIYGSCYELLISYQ